VGCQRLQPGEASGAVVNAPPAETGRVGAEGSDCPPKDMKQKATGCPAQPDRSNETGQFQSRAWPLVRLLERQE